MTTSLNGKVALVTGAARGIGRAVARRFAEAGARVIAIDVIDNELDISTAELREAGYLVDAVPADISCDQQVTRLIQQVLGDHGQIDVLANVAGVIQSATCEETLVADWDRILGVNLRGPFLLCKAVIPAMKIAGAGSIINVSSRSGIEGTANLPAYSASKFGLEGLSRCLALDLSSSGIAVNTITPGVPTHTAMSETTYGPEMRKVWRDPYLITPAFLYLATQTSAGVTNQRIDAWKLSEQLRNEGAL